MLNNEIVNLLRYSTPYCLYIVNENKRIEMRSCPFKVLVVHQMEHLNQGKQYLVTKIGLSKSKKLIFRIDNKYYWYWYFEIL